MGSGHTTPTAATMPSQEKPQSTKPLPRLSSTNLARTMVRDVSVEVVIAPLSLDPDGTLRKSERKKDYENAMQVSCIISIWSIDYNQYYTLTFTSAVAADSAPPPASRLVTRTNTGARLDKSRSSGSSSSSSGRRSGSSSNSTSKAVTPTLQQPEFPPRGPLLGARPTLPIQPLYSKRQHNSRMLS